MFPVMILAGGLATRLRPITEKIPKALLQVAGKPFVFHQLHYLRRQGIRRVILCTGYLGDQIEEVVGNGTAFDLEVDYSPDGPMLLGTGGAIRKALSLVQSPFFVLYGDSFLPIRYKDVEDYFIKSGKPALMTVFRNANRWDKSNVLFREGRLIEYNKLAPRTEMAHIDYGLGILSPKVFEGSPKERSFDLAEVYHGLSIKDSLSGFEVTERFYEVGSLEGIRETENYFLSQENLMSYSQQHLKEATEIIAKINTESIEKMADLLAGVKQIGGRIFFLGVGGSAGNCSHAVNDFRKIVGIESYAPTDNVSELTARTNDEGWASIFVEWLKISKLSSKDALFIFSVGGGNLEKNISPNLVTALQLAKTVGAKITGVVGRDGGYTAQVADAYVIIPTVNPETVTPHSEAFQAVIWHLLVSHPKLKANQTKWESTSR